MNEEFEHLLPSAQLLANDSDELRIRRIRTDRWIGYPRAEGALMELEDLLSFPQRNRMPNLLLVGPTNNGKSMVVEKFRRLRATDRPGDDPAAVASRMQVLRVQMPSGPDEKRFFAALLAALGTPSHINARLVHAAQESTVTLMRASGVKLLVIDELHNVLAGTRDQQRRLLNLLRWLGNELQVPLVAVGTSDALHAIQSDDQLANRFKPFALPLWRAEAEFLRLLNTLEAVLPLRRPSGLSEPGLARMIMTAAEGLLGEITAFVTQAAVYAIRSGQECITRETLENLGFIPPSRRRHALE